MAYDPLTQSYLALTPPVPLVTPQQAAQQRLSLQQLANQTAIQQQVQQENALKLQAAAEDRQDDENYQNEIQRVVLKAKGVPAAATNIDASATTPPAPAPPVENQETGVAGTPAEIAPATPPPATTPTGQSPSSIALANLQAQGLIKPRNVRKYEAEDLAHQQAISAYTKDQLEQHKLKNEQVGGPIFAAIQEDDPEEQNALYAMALRQAGPDAAAYPQTLPNDPKQRDHLLRTLAFANGYTGQLIDLGIKTKQGQLDQAKADAESAKTFREQLTSAAQVIASATDQDDLQQKTKALRAQGTPQAVLDLFPLQWSADIAQKAGRLGMSPKDLATAANKTPAAVKTELANLVTAMKAAKPTDQDSYDAVLAPFSDTVKAMVPSDYSDEVVDQIASIGTKPVSNAIKFSPEITAALVATGAKDPTKPTQTEMNAAVKFDTAQKIAARPSTNIVIPADRTATAQAIANYQEAPPLGTPCLALKGRRLWPK